MKSILGLLNSGNGLQRITALINDISTAYNVSSNPVGALEDMICNNPKYKQFKGVVGQAERYANENGGYETAFRKLASENGLNADNVINMIKNMM